MSLEAWLSFRAGENPREPKLICCECGGKAEGEVDTRDNEDSPWEPLCNACHALDVFIFEEQDREPSDKQSSPSSGGSDAAIQES